MLTFASFHLKLWNLRIKNTALCHLLHSHFMMHRMLYIYMNIAVLTLRLYLLVKEKNLSYNVKHKTCKVRWAHNLCFDFIRKTSRLTIRTITVENIYNHEMVNIIAYTYIKLTLKVHILCKNKWHSVNKVKCKYTENWHNS